MNDKPGELINKARICLVDAVNYDHAGKINDAVPKYIEGIALLGSALREMAKNDPRADKIRQNQLQYTERAEALKGKCKYQVDFLEQRRIEANSIGHGYDKIFSKCCDAQLTWVDVQDAYIVKHHQSLNFLRLCELLVQLSRNLKTITLKTGKDAESNKECFGEMAESLKKRGVTLHVEFCTTIHDREISFNNGWCVKIGRGLDYFKPLGKYSLGACDMNLRPCHETTVDIFKRKRV